MPPKKKLLTPDAAFCTTDLTSLLDVVARARREHIGVSEANAPRNPQDLMTLGRIREWFCRDRYVLGEVIAEGGMARIYRAADLHMCRTVALKLPAEHRPSPLNLTRCLLEAQITAQLEHPNIIPVHDIGVDPLLGLPFFTMEYVAGLTLREVVVGLRQHDPEIRRLYGSLGERLNVILKPLMPFSLPIRCMWCTGTSSPPTSWWARTAGFTSSTGASPSTGRARRLEGPFRQRHRPAPTNMITPCRPAGITII